MGNICCENQREEILVPHVKSGISELKRNYHFNSSTKTLGQGAFGKVFLTNNKFNEDHWVAVKLMSKKKLQSQLSKIYQEVAILNTLDHNNIVKYYETYDDPDGNIYLIMEYIKGGELLAKIESREDNCLTEPEARNYSRQLFGALAHMHSLNIAHRDIKPENIMLTDHDEVKFVDFGLSKISDGGGKMMKTICGTPYYMAPELLERQVYDTKCDMWSMGVILYVLMSGYLPF